ncbi:MAG: cell wall-active antibiotics response protein LiaF [Anaerolineae bacterium]
MRGRTQVIVGVVVLGLGLLLLVGNLANIDVWSYLWPTLLIGLGVYLVVRSQRAEKGGPVDFHLLGDIYRRGRWAVRDEEVWCVIGDINLDLTDAIVPPGETTIRLRGFVGDVTVTVPEEVGIAVASTAFVTDARVFHHKQDYFLTPYESESDNYHAAERKIRVESLYFVSNLRIRRSRLSTG